MRLIDTAQGQRGWVHALDTDRRGSLSSNAIGQKKTVQALKILLLNKINASLFARVRFFIQISSHEHRPKDFADVIKISNQGD